MAKIFSNDRRIWEFNKTYIPLALVKYDVDMSNSARYLSPHVRRALVEYLLIILWYPTQVKG